MEKKSLEHQKMRVEVIKLDGTKAELDFKVQQHLHDIERIKDHKKACEDRQQELREKLGDK